MNKKDLANFKKILIQKKTEFLNKTNNVQRELKSDLDVSIGDEIDTATQNSEKEMFFELAANDRITLNAINDALVKIEKECGYGLCESCNSAILLERLNAIPWTRYCIKCQEEAENLKR